MYSTMDGRLTPTAPVYEDMRTKTPLNVTSEGSMGGLSAAVGGIESEIFRYYGGISIKCCTSYLHRN